MATTGLGRTDADLAAVETAIRAAMTQIGAGLLEQLLGADGGYRGPRIDCGAGHSARFVGYRDKSITTVLGAVTVRRGYYRCIDCGHGVLPRDEELGVAGVSLSPGLRKITAIAAAAAPFGAASTLLADLAGIRLGTKRIERSGETDGAAAADRQARESAAICRGELSVLTPTAQQPLPDKLYIAIDGTGVPMTAAAVAGRHGKGPDGRAHTREVKLAAVFTQTAVDDDGRAIRDPDSTSFAAVGDFAPLAAAEATRRGAEQIRQLVVLGDGAAWIWNLATTIWPHATPIVDLYHAREHLHALADLLTDSLGADRDHWLQARLADLDAGDIEHLVTSTQNLLPTLHPLLAVSTAKALGYFTTNAHRMRYGYFRDLGLFVGSGVVEAGCKTIIGARLKQSGMHWNIPGATGIIALRSLQASNRFDTIWTHPHNQMASA